MISNRKPVAVQAGPVTLAADLALPNDARGLVIFAHGSGSSRFSERNRYVADVLEHGGFATLLLDLLTEVEAKEDRLTSHLRFDIDLLSQRVVAACQWAAHQPGMDRLPFGLFGASTGAAAALIAAAMQRDRISAVVSRGGRPDLAERYLPRVRAPSLFVVGGADGPVIGMNEQAAAQMRAPVDIRIVPRATHLFPEPGALEQVGTWATAWFQRYLSPSTAVDRPTG